jgi:hypothetical protein
VRLWELLLRNIVSRIRAPRLQACRLAPEKVDALQGLHFVPTRMMAAPAWRAKSMFNGFGMAEANALAQKACSKEMLALPAFPPC